MEENVNERPTKEQLLKLKKFVEDENNMALVHAGHQGGQIDTDGVEVYDHDKGDYIDVELYDENNPKHEPMISCVDIVVGGRHDPLSLVTEVDIDYIEFVRKISSPI